VAKRSNDKETKRTSLTASIGNALGIGGGKKKEKKDKEKGSKPGSREGSPASSAMRGLLAGEEAGGAAGGAKALPTVTARPFAGHLGALAPSVAELAKLPPPAVAAMNTEWMTERVVKGLSLVGCTVQVLQESSPELPARLPAEPGAAAAGAAGSAGAAPEFVVGVVVEYLARALYLIQFPNAPAKMTELGEGAVWMVQRKGRWSPLGLADKAGLECQPESFVGRYVRVRFPVAGGETEQWGVGQVTAHVSGTTFEVAYNNQEVEQEDLFAEQCMLWELPPRRASLGGIVRV
jgi:hypothetical protein